MLVLNYVNYMLNLVHCLSEYDNMDITAKTNTLLTASWVNINRASAYPIFLFIDIRKFAQQCSSAPYVPMTVCSPI